jgi:hypothetical protein
MLRLHLSRAARSILFLVTLGLAIAACATLWWANHTGLPPSWRGAIETECAKRNIHIRIGALSWLPLRGLAAKDVRIFSDADKTVETAALERIRVELDKTKLARGIVRPTRLALDNARIVLRVSPEDPASESLVISRAKGTIRLSGDGSLETRKLRGEINGIAVELDASLSGFRQTLPARSSPTPPGRKRELLARVIRELDRWDFGSERPILVLRLNGDVAADPGPSGKAEFRARSLSRNDHELTDVRCLATFDRSELAVSSFSARDQSGSLDGRAHYATRSREGRFALQSSLEALPLLKAWFGLNDASAIPVGGSQRIRADGSFSLADPKKPSLRASGKIDLGSVRLRGIDFDRAQASFALRDGDLFLRDAVLSRPDGTATGKFLLNGKVVRVAAKSDMPLAVWKLWFANEAFGKVLADFQPRPGARCQADLHGGFTIGGRNSWRFEGEATLEDTGFRGVPLDLVRCKFDTDAAALRFRDGTVTFAYRDYPLRESHGGPVQGTVRVDEVVYDSRKKQVSLQKVRGEFWAAPLVRLFAPKLADSLEQYRFHRPPAISGDGIIGTKDPALTALDISFRSPDPASYRFLAKDLTLLAPSGRIGIEGRKVRIRDLACGSFDGTLRASFDADGKGGLAGELVWKDLSLAGIGSTYSFPTKGGQLTGRTEFSIIPGKPSTMNGSGNLAIEDTELFSVPVFGPLSPLVAGVLNNRRSAFEQATDAFFTFRIRDGILSTRDFDTRTRSLLFTGDGEVDLADLTLDFTMRMNARGLLGLITLPLRPFYGMFQFRGTGPLRKPEWNNVMFTSPADEPDSPQTPPRALPVEE